MTALAIGSVHGSGGRAAREAQLDSIIKCPSCEDLSIAQSGAPSAIALRHRVDEFVTAGWSDSRIEAWITGRYGNDSLLVPEPGGVSDTLYLVPVIAIGCGVLGLGVYFWRRRTTTEPRPSDARVTTE